MSELERVRLFSMKVEELRRRKHRHLLKGNRRAVRALRGGELSVKDIIDVAHHINASGEVRVVAPPPIYYKFKEMLSPLEFLSHLVSPISVRILSLDST